MLEYLRSFLTQVFDLLLIRKNPPYFMYPVPSKAGGRYQMRIILLILSLGTAQNNYSASNRCHTTSSASAIQGPRVVGCNTNVRKTRRRTGPCEARNFRMTTEHIRVSNFFSLFAPPLPGETVFASPSYRLSQSPPLPTQPRPPLATDKSLSPLPTAI